MPWIAANNRHTAAKQVHLRVMAAEEFFSSLHQKESASETEIEQQQQQQQHKALRDKDPGQTGFVNPESLKEFGQEAWERIVKKGFVNLFARTNPRFIVKMRLDEKVPQGAVVMHEILCLNQQVTTGTELFPWSIYEKEDPSLAFINFEIRPRFDDEDVSNFEFDRKLIVPIIKKALWGFPITIHERFLVQLNGIQFALRVKDISEEEDDEEEEGEEQTISINDAFRGILETTTVICLEQDPTFLSGFKLVGEQQDPKMMKEKNLANIADIYCQEEEYFPVKKKLLRPCIALAKTVLSKTAERPVVHVDLDCCTFDKVLRFLECEFREEEFKFDLLEVDELLGAAKLLKLKSLERKCEEAVGKYKSSIRNEIPFDEIQKRNKQGEIILIIDNCVINATDWLDEHPGGNQIIPEQALNVDATVLFEVYHASRESFLFLKQLYIGMLKKEDQDKVPPPANHVTVAKPSDSFLIQFREFMGRVHLFKSF